MFLSSSIELLLYYTFLLYIYQLNIYVIYIWIYSRAIWVYWSTSFVHGTIVNNDNFFASYLLLLSLSYQLPYVIQPGLPVLSDLQFFLFLLYFKINLTLQLWFLVDFIFHFYVISVQYLPCIFSLVLIWSYSLYLCLFLSLVDYSSWLLSSFSLLFRDWFWNLWSYFWGHIFLITWP